ncbi:MAG: sulfotransferase [Lentimicrobium sp.]
MPFFLFLMEQKSQIPVFFIIGRPRTGTTLLQSLFDAHPGISIPWECQFVLNLYPAYGKITHWRSDQLEAFYADLLNQWQFSSWNIDHEKLRNELLKCTGDHSYRDICQVVYLNFVSFYPKDKVNLIGDKNHGYTIYTSRLRKIYPEAKFIYMLRDYRDNFDSVKRVDFEVPIVSLVVFKWKYFYRKALRASKKYPDSFFFIRYEDLVSEPEKYFSKISDFLTIPFMPEVFDFYKMKGKAEETYPTDVLEKHHKSLFNPINTSRLGLWKKSMSETQVKIADLVAGKYAEQAGYERKYKRFNPYIALLAFPGVFYAECIYLLTYLVDRFPYRLREKILSKGPLMIAKLFSGLFRKKT